MKANNACLGKHAEAPIDISSCSARARRRRDLNLKTLRAFMENLLSALNTKH